MLSDTSPRRNATENGLHALISPLKRLVVFAWPNRWLPMHWCPVRLNDPSSANKSPERAAPFFHDRQTTSASVRGAICESMFGPADDGHCRCIVGDAVNSARTLDLRGAVG